MPMSTTDPLDRWLAWDICFAEQVCDDRHLGTYVDDLIQRGEAVVPSADWRRILARLERLFDVEKAGRAAAEAKSKVDEVLRTRAHLARQDRRGLRGGRHQFDQSAPTRRNPRPVRSFPFRIR